MKIVHYDDGKGKFQSHEIYLKEDPEFYNKDPEVFSHDLSDLRGYGETKEEALKEFGRKLEYLMNEYKALEKMFFETDLLIDDIRDVDRDGNILPR